MRSATRVHVTVNNKLYTDGTHHNRNYRSSGIIVGKIGTDSKEGGRQHGQTPIERRTV